ncbi:PfkB family carbohydrate kinase [Butyrivibrio fibrisolvens]|uniref:PfkB family carbohydrate kinase n=1 Tax=Butyrivibrio fibrisolvens TaxID=831 RepID=UPI0004055193|nr:PfkB family carbohydrate kinase [Butyrivibrio fibrisolvens]
MEKVDVVALGELLIDFTENGISAQGNPIMEANPGGAVCNVLSMLSGLSKSTAYIGKVGKDIFGKQLTEAIRSVGIDDSGLVVDDNVNTTLAFVHTYEDGDRDFSFYRNPGADMMLTVDELNLDLVRNCRIFHYGSLSMTNKCCEEATFKAIEVAKKSGAIISFDPNLREPLWDSLDHAKEEISKGMKQCDILKISDNEIIWFTGKEDFDEGVEELRKQFNPKLITVTMGKDGSRAYYGDKIVSVPGFVNKNTIETTGAGDTFGACVLNYILEQGLDGLTEDDLKEMLTFANAAASIITTRKGALKVMPTKEEVEKLACS